MNRALRILDVIHSLDRERGGPAEGLRQMIAGTRTLGHVQEVLTLDAPGSAYARDVVTPVHAIGPARGNYGWTPRLAPWLRAHAPDYDAVVVHGLWQYPGAAVHAALRSGPTPYLVWPHGMLDPWFRHAFPFKHAKKWLYWQAIERHVLRDAAAVLFTTEEEARLAPRSFAPYAARESVLGYGLEVEDSAREARAEDFLRGRPSLDGRRLLLFLGRIHPKKGCDLLLRAFAGVAPSAPELQLVMAGPDAVGHRAELEAIARALGIGERLTWTGMLHGREKWGALRAADAFVLPSHQENFGIAVAEALSAGLPVLVSTQVNIWREVVRDGAGYAAADTEAGTIELLQRWLALDEGERQRMRACAVACFDAHFHMSRAAERLIGLVRSMRDERPPAHGVGAIHRIETWPDQSA